MQRLENLLKTSISASFLKAIQLAFLYIWYFDNSVLLILCMYFIFLQCTDWDRFAAEEYELLVAEEGNTEGMDEM